MRHARAALLIAALGLPAPAALAQGASHLLVVSGIGGEAYYSELFRDWALTLLDVAATRFGLAPERLTWLAEQPGQPRSAGVSRKEQLADAVRRIAERSAPGDTVLVVLLGHGTARDGRALFNLPGPDLAAGELADLLALLAGRQVALVNTASASGAFVAELSAPGRVIVTATASGAEYNHPRFGGHFVAAFAQAAADADKDGRVSLLEAFLLARRQVARAYEADERILTEHALLEDNGDGVGSREPGEDADDGGLAARLFLAPQAVPVGAHAEALLALQIEARELVAQVARLRRDRERLRDADYENQLEALLVALALNRRALRAGGLP